MWTAKQVADMSKSLNTEVQPNRYKMTQKRAAEMLQHAHKYVNHLAPCGSSLELDALNDALITLELAQTKVLYRS
jgi:hypothetical protein